MHQSHKPYKQPTKPVDHSCNQARKQALNSEARTANQKATVKQSTQASMGHSFKLKLADQKGALFDRLFPFSV